MNILALDSATDQMALALQCGDRAWHCNAPGGALSSQRMIPELLALLDSAGLSLSELDAVAFGQGPGAFTGLRTAVSVTQGLALGAGLPVLAIDSLMIVAEDWRMRQAEGALDAAATVWVAMDARMDEIYAAGYRHDGQRWRVVQPPALHDPATLNLHWQSDPPAHLVGSAPALFGERLQPGLSVSRQPADAPTDRAAALLRLACGAWLDGRTLPVEQVLPVYLRDKVALTTLERDAVRAAKAAA